jgi:serine/threonine protein kinase
LGVDVWALGLFMYNFIEGKNPFHNGDLARTYNRIVKGEFEFTSDNIRWLNGRPAISRDAKDLMSKILKVNPAERPTFNQILQHPYFINPSDAVPYYCLPSSLPTSILDSPISPEYVALLQEKAK